MDVIPERFPGRVLLLQQILKIISSFIQEGEEGAVPAAQSKDGGFYMSSPGELCLLLGLFLGLPAALESRTDLTLSDYTRM